MVGSYWFLALMVLASAAAAVIGLRVVRKFVDHEKLVVHNEVAGYMLSIIGTLYAVVLGLLVVNALNTFQQARVVVMHEANSLHDIFRTAHGMPTPYDTKIRNICLDYARNMVGNEWKEMEVGKPSLRGHELTADLWRSTVDFKPSTTAEGNLQQVLLAQMDELSDCRQTRLMGAQPAFDFFIWGVMLLGGIGLVVFTYFFGVEKLAVQAIMTVMVALALSLNMMLVVMFGYPYSGDVKVSAQPFVFDVDSFQREMNDKN